MSAVGLLFSPLILMRLIISQLQDSVSCALGFLFTLTYENPAMKTQLNQKIGLLVVFFTLFYAYSFVVSSFLCFSKIRLYYFETIHILLEITFALDEKAVQSVQIGSAIRPNRQCIFRAKAVQSLVSTQCILLGRVDQPLMCRQCNSCKTGSAAHKRQCNPSITMRCKF